MSTYRNDDSPRDKFRHIVLDALDVATAAAYPRTPQVEGWLDRDLPELFKAVDAQFEKVVARVAERARRTYRADEAEAPLKMAKQAEWPPVIGYVRPEQKFDRLHTRGPWTVTMESVADDGYRFLAGPGWTMFARVVVQINGTPSPTGEANLRLIKSAPDLLDYAIATTALNLPEKIAAMRDEVIDKATKG